jgi:hypothetical protein
LPSSDEGGSRSDASALYRQLMSAKFAGGSQRILRGRSFRAGARNQWQQHSLFFG